MVFYLKQLNPHYLYQGCFVSYEVLISPVLMERELFNVINVLSFFLYHLPLENDVVFNLNKVKFPLLKDVLCHVWLKLVHRFLRSRQKCEKILHMQTKDSRQAIRKDHCS